MIKIKSAPLAHKVLVAAVIAGVASIVSGAPTTAHAASKMPTVTMMVGGLNKQIYLPYQLAQNLGFYKKYGVHMVLSTEKEGKITGEQAMLTGKVDMTGSWYVHTIGWQIQGKNAIDIVQLSHAPGEREMCATGSGIHSPKGWKGKSVGVTDIGSGTDDLTRYLAARAGLTTKQFNRVGVGAGESLIKAMKDKKVVCAMTTQPTVTAIEKQGIGYSAINLATGKGVKKWLGGYLPTAAVLARKDWVEKHQVATQRVVDALVATMHWIHTHSAADIAKHLPADFVTNPLSTKKEYIAALAEEKGQFVADGLMPSGGPQKWLDVERGAGKDKKKVDLATTYTNKYAKNANKMLGYSK